MRKLISTMARAGRDREVWPVALLLFAVIVPAACLLWFMNAAMRNERAAARQKIADAYLSQLSSARIRFDQTWIDIVAALEKLAGDTPAPVAFARCIASGKVDAVVLFDAEGRVAYPNSAAGSEMAFGELEPRWTAAGRLEHLSKDPAAAAEAYAALAKESTNANLSARALQAQARCLTRAGQKDAAVRLIDTVLGGERYTRAADPQGRLIVANTELMALELVADRGSPLFQAVAQRLQRRLMDYENPSLASPQRRFLMKELQRLSPGIEFPTLAAEELAAQRTENQSASMNQASGDRTSSGNVWQFAGPGHRLVALVRSDRLLAAMNAAANPLPDGTELALLPPDTDHERAFISLPAGAQWPGWRWAFLFRDGKLFEASMQHRAAIYLWTGLLVLAVMGALGLLSIRILRREMSLARLKNDLVATVSHELRTPLSSMRVLVETLLNSEKLDERTTREYLQIIHQENERLSRLIRNFLTFSRMERNKFAFHFAPLPARQVVDAAVEAGRERLEAPGCRFELEIAPGLPGIVADPEALATALSNLLDNAGKYTEDIKHIRLRVHADGGKVIFSVQDNGIGIDASETKKIFQRFYQVDQRLSGKGGCGLGLSIVQHIVTAHRGTVSVESRPGSGSTFSISIPAASLPRLEKEAAA